MVDAVTAAHHKSYLDRRPHVPKKFTELLEEYKYNPSIRGDAQLKLLFSYISEMQIGPYLWIRHWLEYEYGKEYFDALLEEVISVHAESRTNEEYFCSELNKEEIAEVVYYEGKMFCFTRKGSNWFQAKAKSMQNGRASEGNLKSPNGWFKLPRASSQDIGGHKHHMRVYSRYGIPIQFGPQSFCPASRVHGAA